MAPATRAAREKSVLGDGERRRWQVFVEEHGDDLRQCVVQAMRAFGMRTQPEDVDEMSQEVYCRLLETNSLEHGTHGPRLYGYLKRVARSVLVDYMRSVGAAKRGSGRVVAAGGVDDEVDLVSLHADPGPTPEELLLSAEGHRRLRRRLCQVVRGPLAGRNLHILELAVIEGETPLEISRRIGGSLSASGVHSVIHRARRVLRQQYRPSPIRGSARTQGGGALRRGSSREP